MNLKITVAAACFAAVASAAAQVPGEAVAPNFNRAIPNIPGKSLVAVVVDYSPGGASPAHTHARSAFIFGYVVSGAVETQVEGEPVRTVRAGESFYEDPGAHHLVSRNASSTEPAKLLAVSVVDTNDRTLTTSDR
jgi:quercetin dioxygenase-like cupin family protein